MAALELVIQEHIEERRHFIVDFDISRLWLAEKHLHELWCHITGDDFAVPPVVVFEAAIAQSQLDPLGFLIPTVDLKGLGNFQRSGDICSVCS